MRLITFFFFSGRFFDETSQGTDGDAGGKRKESGEAQWELLEQKEADGKTDTNRSENSFCVRLEADNSLKPLIISRNHEDTYKVGCLPESHHVSRPLSITSPPHWFS